MFFNPVTDYELLGTIRLSEAARSDDEHPRSMVREDAAIVVIVMLFKNFHHAAHYTISQENRYICTGSTQSVIYRRISQRLAMLISPDAVNRFGPLPGPPCDNVSSLESPVNISTWSHA